MFPTFIFNDEKNEVMERGDPSESVLDALYPVTQRLMFAQTEQEIYDVAVWAIPVLFDVPFGGLWLYDERATELQLTAETEAAARLHDGEMVYRPGNSLSWVAFESGDLQRYPEDASESVQYNPDATVRSELIVPVGEYGVLNIATEDEDAFTERDVQVARLLAVNVESALAKAQREHALEVQNDRLEEFVGMVSHDLQNPLSVASGNLELARTPGEDEYLDTVADALERMETLIDDLLKLAEQGYVVESRTTIELRSLARKAWSTVQTPDATLEIDGTVELFGDKPRLRQVFENLFRNSVEHAGPDVTVTVGSLGSLPTTTRQADSKYGDGFFVADDGPGIPHDDASTVFESGQSTAGTGLGLAIVERIVEAHGWRITAGESVQSGARFEVTGGAKPVTPFEFD